MKTPALRICSTLLFSGALAAMFAGTSCTADVETEDERSGDHHDCDKAPTVETKRIVLWPPNHELVEIDIDDCLEEVKACDDEWEATVLWASSDEPVNAQGDGNTAPDIVCDHDEVKVRAERSGKGDGRVYRIGIEIKDSHDKKTTAVCKVEVPHDMGPYGDAVDSGEAYRVEC